MTGWQEKDLVLSCLKWFSNLFLTADCRMSAPTKSHRGANVSLTFLKPLMRDCEEACQCDNNYRNCTIQQLQASHPLHTSVAFGKTHAHTGCHLEPLSHNHPHISKLILARWEEKNFRIIKWLFPTTALQQKTLPTDYSPLLLYRCSGLTFSPALIV